MAEQVTEYICPACGGPMKFDVESGKVKCDYCASIYEIEEVKNFFAQKNQTVVENPQISEDESYWTEGDSNMKSYKCNSCGAEMVCEETTAATSCPYCGNPAVMPQKFTGMLRPQYVIPFKVDKSEAEEELEKYYKKKLLLPGTFKGHNHINEIKGVYVPFWLYSGTVEADMHFDAEQVSVKTTATEKITTTKHYDVHRKGTVKFDKVPTDASTAMPDDLMDSIEPYDYKDLKNFEMEYLPGYIADKYDVSKEESIERSRNRAENTTADEIKETVDGYNKVRERELVRRVKYSNEKQEYAMLPVWLLSTKWKDQDFLFAVNGQTGKMTGNLPIDKLKQILWFIGSFLFSVAFWELWTKATQPRQLAIIAIASIAFAFLIIWLLRSSMKPVKNMRQAANYMLNEKNPVNLSISRDNYIRTTEKREKIQQNKK